MSDMREREGRPVRVSGSIDLDMSKVGHAIADQVEAKVAALMSPVVDAVIQAVMPALVQIHQAVQTGTGLMFPAGLMSDADARATLASMLPAGLLTHGTAEQVGDFQLQRLTEAGYAVVPVAGAALEHAIKVAQHRQHLAERSSVEDLQRAAGVDVEAVRRADARLKQASECGKDDSWYEDDNQ
jgi:hypothetical protein